MRAGPAHAVQLNAYDGMRAHDAGADGKYSKASQRGFLMREPHLRESPQAAWMGGQEALALAQALEKTPAKWPCPLGE